MWFRLARTVTHTTVKQTQRGMGSREFTAWIEEYKQRPFGDDWEQTAKIITAILQVWTKKKLDWRKFVPKQEGMPGKSPQELEAILMSFSRRHNSAIATQQKKASKKVT
jgi:hypothetical protein